MSDLSQAEIEALLSTLKDMGVKPKADNPDALRAWMVDYLHATGGGAMKLESESGAPSTPGTPATPSNPNSSNPGYVQPPRITFFSGEGGKGDTTFDLWKYEVECLINRKNHTPDVIHEAVRRSLRGEAARIAMRLGPTATTQNLLDKFQSVYGQVEIFESLMALFYSAKQQEDEDVSAWGCRLEDLLMKATESAPVSAAESNRMLRNMFWTGLVQPLKDVSGHKFDTIQDFDQLRVALRRIESDQKHRLGDKSSKKTVTAKMAVSSSGDDGYKAEIKELKCLMQNMNAELSSLKNNQPPYTDEQSGNYGRGRSYSGRGQGRGQGRGYSGHGRGYSGHGRGYSGRGRGYSGGNFSSGGDNSNQANAGAGNEQSDPQEVSDGPVCWRCGQLGHVKLGCRVRMDHSRKQGNYNQSMVRGNP